MKEIVNERQLAVIAKEEIYKLLQKIPSVSNVEIRENITNSNVISDFSVLITTDYKSIKILADVKMRSEKRFIDEYIERVNAFEDNAIRMIISPHISAQTSALLKSCNINYMDLSGNCHIAVDTIYISVEGKANQYIPKRSNKNIFAWSSQKSAIVLKTMLNDYKKEWQIQELSSLTGVSIGMVFNIKNYLLENNWAEKTIIGFRLKNIRDFLWEWASIYNLSSPKAEEYYSFDDIPLFEENISEWNKKRGAAVILGAFSAAARYAPTVRYNKATVYVEISDKEEFIRDFQLKKVDSGGNIAISTIYDKSVTMFPKTLNNSLITSPSQTVLDLLSHSGRGEEAAEAIVQKEFDKL